MKPGLESLGIGPGQAEAPYAEIASQIPYADYFFELADDKLERLEDFAWDVIAKLDQPEYLRDAYWDSFGSMVFPIGNHPRLGTLSLRIWPEGLGPMEHDLAAKEVGQEGEAWPPSPVGKNLDTVIRNQRWHTASIVLAGCADTSLDVEQISLEELVGPERLEHKVLENDRSFTRFVWTEVDEKQAAANGLHRLFRFKSSSRPGEPEIAVPAFDDYFFKVTGEQMNDPSPGDLHAIEANDNWWEPRNFYVPEINGLGAVLCWDSVPVLPAGYGPDALVQSPFPQRLEIVRRPVTVDEARIAKHQLREYKADHWEPEHGEILEFDELDPVKRADLNRAQYIAENLSNRRKLSKTSVGAVLRADGAPYDGIHRPRDRTLPTGHAEENAFERPLEPPKHYDSLSMYGSTKDKDRPDLVVFHPKLGDMVVPCVPLCRPLMRDALKDINQEDIDIYLLTSQNKVVKTTLNKLPKLEEEIKESLSRLP